MHCTKLITVHAISYLSDLASCVNYIKFKMIIFDQLFWLDTAMIILWYIDIFS